MTGNFFDQFDDKTAAKKAALEIKGKEAQVASIGANTARTTQITGPQVALTTEQVKKLRADQAREEKEEADKAAAAAETAKSAHLKAISDTGNLLANIQQARDNIGFWSTGPGGQVLQNVWGSPSADLQASLEGVTAPTVLEAMQAARKGSATGATGFGALSEKELALLSSTIASLRQKQGPDQLLANLNRVEEHFRRFQAYNSGIDPDTPEGAHWAGLPAPDPGGGPGPAQEGTTKFSGEGTVQADPTLRGVDATVAAMVKAGRTGDQIRAWLNEVQPGLGDRTKGIDENVAAWKAKPVGWDPRVGIEHTFKPNEAGVGADLAKALDNPFGAAVAGYGDVVSGGLLDELSGKQAQSSAALHALQDEHSVAFPVGQLLGGGTQAALGQSLAAKYGLKVAPWLMDAAQGGTYGAGSAEPGQRWQGAATGAVLGAGVGSGARAVGKALGTMARGVQDTHAELLSKYGIPLSIGEIVRGDVKRFEDKAMSWPVVGGQIRGIRQDGRRAFNVGAFKEALAPLGVDLGDEIGQSAVAKAQAAVHDAYGKALDGVTLTPDTPFVQTVRGAPYQALSQVPEHGTALAQEVDNALLSNIAPNGTMSGDAFQAARQRIGDLKREYSDVRGYHRLIKPHLNSMESALDDMMRRQAPGNFEQYVAANRAHQHVSILGDAVDYSPADAGELFTPAILRQKARQNSITFGGKNASARGDRPFNALTQAGTRAMSPGLPNSGTADRMLLPLLAGSLMGGGRYAVGEGQNAKGETERSGGSSLLTGLGTAMLAAAPYSRIGQRTLQSLVLGDRPDAAKWLGEAMQRYTAPAVRTALPAVLSSRARTPPKPDVAAGPDPIIARALAAAAKMPHTAAPKTKPSIVYDPDTGTFSIGNADMSTSDPADVVSTQALLGPEDR